MPQVKYTADGLPYYDATDQQTQPYFPQANGPMLPAPGIPGTMPEAWNAGVRGLAGSLMDTLAAPGRAMQGMNAVQPSVPGLWSEEDEFRRQHAMGRQVGQATDLAFNVMGNPVATNVSRPGEMALGIVPVDIGKNLNVRRALPNNETFEAAVRNTPGASIQDGSLVMAIQRNQHPDQALEESIRGGVFYLPQGSKDAKFYTGTGHNFGYGGTEKIAGETAVNNPLFVKGATGGKAPETAFDQLNGKGAYQSMRSEALRAAAPYNLPGYPAGGAREELAAQFLAKYAPELEPAAWSIVQNTKKGNQFAYALQEAAVASAARRAGHDAVLGYSVSRKTKQPFISEMFDVRENVYPSAAGDYGMWPQFRPADLPIPNAQAPTFK
jgi:hypothetical protein